ncbi:unnamed protein product [Adineta steineri]|uniref:Uncharacterized protein n=3 Tax=Adineta steineri TaxID=433720 RepID=A0A815N7L6_9BILA|nr:unnamed protein product [Adineta steineri]
MNAQMIIANIMVKTAKTLTRLNRMMPSQDFQNTMQMFDQNMTANNIKQEMMNDAMDSVFEGEDDEDATEELVNQVLNELNIDVANQVPHAPQAISTVDARLEARLNVLREM